MANRRFETFRLLLLLVLLSLLDLVQFAVNLSCHVRNVNGDSGLAHVVLAPDLHSCKTGLLGSILGLVIHGATLAPSLTDDTVGDGSVKFADQFFGGVVTLSLLNDDLIK